MSYVGSAPAPSQVQFSTLDAQSFNGNGSTTAFTLNRAVSLAAAIEVTVNNVQQSPYDGSYTVNGSTTLTFSEAPSSGTDNIYVRFLDYPLASITPGDNTVGLDQLSATGTPSSSTYLRGDNTWASVASSQWTTSGSNIYYNTGSVGIGITSPNAKLEVQSSGTSTSAGGNISGRFSSNGSGYAATIQFSDSVTNAAWISMVGGNLAFGPASTERMRIDSSGNVGVGTTSPLSATNQTSVTINGTNFGRVDLYSGGSQRAYWYGGSTGSSLGAAGATYLAFDTNSTERMRIDSSGNVGIGTNSPSYKLHVSGSRLYLVSSGNTELMTTNTTGSVTGGIQALSSQSIRVGSITNWPTEFVVNNNVHASIDSSGIFRFNSGYGSAATAYGCRAWVNFNGTGTVAIRASGNVSSITDIATGSYRINISSAMPDANYSIVGSNSPAGTSDVDSFLINCQTGSLTQENPTTTTFAVTTTQAGSGTRDPQFVNIAIFR